MNPLSNEQKAEIARQFVTEPKSWSQPNGNVYDCALCDIGNVTIIFVYGYTKPSKPGFGLSVQGNDPEDILNRLKELQIESPGFMLNEDQLGKNIKTAEKKNAKPRTLWFYRDGCEAPQKAYEQIVASPKDATAWRSFFKELVTKVSTVVDATAKYHGQVFDSDSSHDAQAGSPLVPASHPADQNDKPLSRNLIYFGAPGTGKSHKLKEAVEGKVDNAGKASKKDVDGNEIFGYFVDIDNEKVVKRRYERVTFYPTYSYAQFVGCYKPVMKETTDTDGKKSEEIAYQFVPGPFLRVLVDALKDHAHNHCLVIEEINRANAAAVFGDVFQLLDRGGKWSDGDDESIKPFFGDGAASEYDVAASEDIKRYLKEELAKCESARKFLKVVPGKDENGNNIWKECRLRIPSNMYIWATMNSADQGVFPMDTAFKRRWEFKYVGIDEGYNKQGDKGAPSEWVVGDSGYYWDQIRRFVNKQLSDNGVNEDKLMGPWFVKPENNKSVSADQFKSKVLMYLWEDAGRMCRKKLFGDKIKTYSDIVDTWPGAKDVFKNVTDKDDENWKAPWNKTGEHA